MELDVLWEFLGYSRLFFYLYAAGLVAVVGKILKNFLTLKEGWIFRILFCLYVVMVTVMVIFAGDEVNILGALCSALGVSSGAVPGSLEEPAVCGTAIFCAGSVHQRPGGQNL